jgi:hypothetical protein
VLPIARIIKKKKKKERKRKRKKERKESGNLVALGG